MSEKKSTLAGAKVGDYVITTEGACYPIERIEAGYIYFGPFMRSDIFGFTTSDVSMTYDLRTTFCRLATDAEFQNWYMLESGKQGEVDVYAALARLGN